MSSNSVRILILLLLISATGGYVIHINHYSHFIVDREQLSRDRPAAQMQTTGTPILDTAMRGRTTHIEELIATGADINQGDSSGYNPLMAAAANLDTTTVELLLANGANIEALDNDQRTALLYASHGGKNEIVALLLAKGANIKHRDKSGQTSLLHAVREGNCDTLNVLLESGANAQDRWDDEWDEGQTALELALSEGFTKCAQLLSANGAIDVAEGFLDHALIQASADVGYDDIALSSYAGLKFKRLVESATNVHATTIDKETALHRAMSSMNISAIKLLLEKGSNVNSVNNDGRSPFDMVEYNSNLTDSQEAEIVTLLLKHGADPYIGRDSGAFAILRLLQSKNIPAIQALLDAEANIELKNKWGGLNVLQQVAKDGNLRVVKLLLNNGSDINALDENGETALQLAVRFDRADTVAFLLDSLGEGEKKAAELTNALPRAAASGKVNTLTVLLERGGNPNAVEVNRQDYNYGNGHGTSILALAAQGGHIEAAKLLIARGAAIDIHAGEPLRNTVLSGQLEMVKLLLDRGVDVNARAEETWLGETALALVAKEGNQAILRLILEKSPDLQDRWTGNWRALFYACRKGYSEIIKDLLKAGINIEYRSVEDHTPLIETISYGHLEAVRVLLNSGADPNAENKKTFVMPHNGPNFRGTALAWSIHKKRSDITELLIEYGAK